MKKIFLVSIIFLSLLNAKVQLSTGVYNELTLVQKLSGEKKYDKALILLNEKLSKNINKADRAFLLQSKGYILISKNDYKNAIEALEEMNSLEIMEETTYIESLYNLGQLYMSEKNYKKSIEYLKEYAKKTKKPNARAYIMIGQNYLLLEKTKKAISPINEAVKIKKLNKEEVPLSWYNLLFSSYYKVKDYDNAIKCLDIMVRLKPGKKEYWQYLYQLYTLKNDLKKALNTFEQAYNLNLLEGKDILQFSGFLAGNGLYYKSAKLLEKHIKLNHIKADEKNLSFLFNLYYGAKEYKKSIETLNKLTRFPRKANIIWKKQEYIIWYMSQTRL